MIKNRINQSIFTRKQAGAMGLFAVIIVFVILTVLGVFVYLLFFSSPPRVEIILPATLQSANEISKVQFVDLVEIVNSEKFKALESYDSMPDLGNLGRSNPFIDYR
jgi:hypothetical protein